MCNWHVTDIRAQKTLAKQKTNKTKQNMELKPLKPAAQEANLWWEHSREQTGRGSSGWSLNTNSTAVAQRLQHMGQLEFGREQELFQRREVASLSNKHKTINICPNLLTHFLLYISAETDSAIAGASSFVKRLTTSGTWVLFCE